MSIPLYHRVVLNRDVLEENLRRGDVAVLLDYLPPPPGGEEGCALEVFNALGDSVGWAVVPVSAIQAVRADDVLAVRSLAQV